MFTQYNLFQIYISDTKNVKDMYPKNSIERSQFKVHNKKILFNSSVI